MNLLDTDKDSHIGFFDFLQPMLHLVPPEVIQALTQDQRFRQETFNDLRLAYDSCKQYVNGEIQATIDALKSKFIEKGPEQDRQLTRALDQLLHLVKHE